MKIKPEIYPLLAFVASLTFGMAKPSALDSMSYAPLSRIVETKRLEEQETVVISVKPEKPAGLEQEIEKTAAQLKKFSERELKIYFKTPREKSLRDITDFFGIDYNLAKAQMWVESRYREEDVSSKDAYGLMQVKRIAFFHVFNMTYSHDPYFKGLREKNPAIARFFYNQFGGDATSALYAGHWKAKIKAENTGSKEDRQTRINLGKKIKKLKRHAWKTAKNDPELLMQAGVAYMSYLMEKFGRTRTALAAYNAGDTYVEKHGVKKGSGRARYSKAVRKLKKAFDGIDAVLGKYDNETRREIIERVL